MHRVSLSFSINHYLSFPWELLPKDSTMVVTNYWMRVSHLLHCQSLHLIYKTGKTEWSLRLSLMVLMNPSVSEPYVPKLERWWCACCVSSPLKCACFNTTGPICSHTQSFLFHHGLPSLVPAVGPEFNRMNLLGICFTCRYQDWSQTQEDRNSWWEWELALSYNKPFWCNVQYVILAPGSLKQEYGKFKVGVLMYWDLA